MNQIILVSFFEISIYCADTMINRIVVAIMNYCLCVENEPGAQVISAATTYDQAAIIWNISKRQVDQTPDIKEAFGVETWAKAISRREIGGNYKPLHAKASTQDGLNPSHIALDEIHAHKTPDLVNVLRSAAGARGNPLWLYTTTEGYENPGPWREQRHFAEQVLKGVVDADRAVHVAAVRHVEKDHDRLDAMLARRAVEFAGLMLEPSVKALFAEKSLGAR